MSDVAENNYQVYPLGDVKLQRGQTLRNAFIAYKTFGVMNAEKDNIIVYPTWLVSSVISCIIEIVNFYSKFDTMHRFLLR